MIKEENGKNLPYFEITELLLAHCYIFNNGYNKIQLFFTYLFRINLLVSY